MEQIVKSKLKNICSNPNYNSQVLYLLHSINESSAFFTRQNKVIYGQCTNIEVEQPNVNTAFLGLNMGISISAISNNTTYRDGKYNFLTYYGNEDDENFISFINLCIIYSETDGLKFEDFFYSLIDIFQLPSVSKELNLIGFFGELSFIIELWEKYRVNLSDIWHVDGSKSRYDFSSPKFNIEIKTTTKESSTFLLKHSQIFDFNNNFITVIHISSSSGYSLYDLIEYCKSTSPFKDNLNFQIRLQEEKLRVDLNKMKNMRFSIDRISIFNKNQLETIDEIPGCITEISYYYTFDLRNSLRIVDVLDDLRSLNK